MSPLRYVAGLVAYDGTDYHGFQYQKGPATIQGTLEQALRSFAQTEGRVVGSGRTDRGVHANGQVIVTRVHWRHSVSALQQAWNAHLPDTICIRGLCIAPDLFHPRFSAVKRTYRYTICQSAPSDYPVVPRRSPLTDRFALFVPQVLDVEAMNHAAEALVGEHDFATFGQPPQGTKTVRQLMQAEWQVASTGVSVLDGYASRTIIFTVTANAFLRQMVRNLVGTLLDVGHGKRSVEDVLLALQAQERRFSSPPSPAHGLVLERVTYPTHLSLFELP